MPKSVEGVMHEFKHGELHSGSKHGPVVRNRKQAIAIALSEQRQRKGKKMKSSRTMTGRPAQRMTMVYGSGPFSESDKKRGYKVMCDASHLMEMDTDQVKNAGPLLARRVDPKKYRRSESTKSKGSY